LLACDDESRAPHVVSLAPIHLGAKAITESIEQNLHDACMTREGCAV
jgi:hypothetical protein